MEIKSLVDAVSKDQGLKKEVVALAVTRAMEKVFQRKNPYTRVEANYDESGSIKLYHFKTVVDSEPEMLDEESEINLPEARAMDPQCDVGDEVGFEMSAELGRVDASIAKQVISEAIKIAQSEEAFNLYSPLKGTVVEATVQKVDGRGALMTLGKVDAFIPRACLIERENLRQNQVVEVFIEDVVMDKNRVKITLSRSAPEMVVEFFKEEVPELQSGEVTMKFCAREAGVKSKFVVDTTESFNPVGVCIGTQGHRIQKVKHRLGGEHIDVVPYTRNLQNFTQSLLGVTKLKGFVVDEQKQEIQVQVEADAVAKAVGPRGVNVKLASLILGYKVRINNQTDEVISKEIKE